MSFKRLTSSLPSFSIGPGAAAETWRRSTLRRTGKGGGAQWRPVRPVIRASVSSVSGDSGRRTPAGRPRGTVGSVSTRPGRKGSACRKTPEDTASAPTSSSVASGRSLRRPEQRTVCSSKSLPSAPASRQAPRRSPAGRPSEGVRGHRNGHGVTRDPRSPFREGGYERWSHPQPALTPDQRAAVSSYPVSTVEARRQADDPNESGANRRARRLGRCAGWPRR